MYAQSGYGGDARLRVFQEAAARLGEYPAEDKIKSLTEMAGAMARSPSAGDALRWLMGDLLPGVQPPCKVPLLYVLDSIIKNIGEPYTSVATDFIVAGVCEAFRHASHKDRNRLVRLTKLWQQRSPPPFPPALFQAMQRYFQPWIDQQISQQPDASPALPGYPPSHFPSHHRHLPPSSQHRHHHHHHQQQQHVPPPVRQPGHHQPPHHGHPSQHAPVHRPGAPNVPQYSNASAVRGGDSGRQAPGRKRLRVDLEDKVLRNMRDLLSQLQAELNEANPMTLEELMNADPKRAEQLRAVAEQQLKSSVGGELASPGNLSPASTAELKRCVVDADRLLQRIQPLRSSQDSGMLAAAETIHGALSQLFQKSAARLGASEDLHHLERHQVASLPPFQAEALGRPVPKVVQALFSLPLVCPTDGLRFKSKAQLEAHEEILAQRRVERLDAGRSRLWYCSATDWMEDSAATGGGPAAVMNKDGNKSASARKDDAATDIKVTSVEMDASITKCKICGEPFDMHHDDATEVWLYKNAIRVDVVTDTGERVEEGLEATTTIVHRSCLATVDKDSLAAGVVKASFLISEDG